MPGPQDLAGLRQAIDALPKVVGDQMRAVAWRVSRDVRSRAQQILRSKTHGTGKTADSIVVIEQLEKKQYLVHCAGDPDRPANLPLWIERGTKFQPARPFMRPAADAFDAQYKREMSAAAVNAAKTVLGGQ